jgi:hypothetical protein
MAPISRAETPRQLRMIRTLKSCSNTVFTKERILAVDRTTVAFARS